MVAHKPKSKHGVMESGVIAATPQKCWDGPLLAIDPSSGSFKSKPGFSLYVGAKLVDCGTIELPAGIPLHTRLQLLCDTLRRDFISPYPAVVAVENVPPYRKNEQSVGQYCGLNKSVLSLQYSMGVAMASIPNTDVVLVSPASWRQLIPAGYNKSDTLDAVMIGYAVLRCAANIMKRKIPAIEDMITGEFMVKLTMDE